MVLSVEKCALVAHAIGVIGDTLADNLAFIPSAFIGSAIGKNDLANALWLALFKLAFIDRSIGEAGCSASFDLAADPVASVFVPIGETVCAFAVLEAVFECAFVNAAVIILFGRNLAILGKSGR